jgi:hypothetical protein
MPTPWSHFVEGRYEEALRGYDAKIAAASKPYYLDHANKALTQLALRRFDDAAKSYAEAARLAEAEGEHTAGMYLSALAATDWLAGRREQAIHRLVPTLEKAAKSKSAASLGPGFSPGLFLLYFAVTTGDDAARDVARRFLEQTRNSRAFRSFAGTVAGYMLGEIEPAELERQADNPRDRCIASFHRGVKLREAGDEAGAKAAFAACLDAGNDAAIEDEWHLGRAEASLA